MKISNKTYNILKWVLFTVVPGATLLLSTLGPIYGWDFHEKVIPTINAFAAFFGVLTGLSSLNYQKELENKEGEKNDSN